MRINLYWLFFKKQKPLEICLFTSPLVPKRCLLLGRKVMTNLDSILKSRDITLPTKVRLVKDIVFPVVMYRWERLRAGGEGSDIGWDGWMASPTQWIWVWVDSGSWWWTGKPGMLQSMGLQRVRHDWVTKLNWTEAWYPHFLLEQWNALLSKLDLSSFVYKWFIYSFN